jgi:hypothetical protein
LPGAAAALAGAEAGVAAGLLTAAALTAAASSAATWLAESSLAVAVLLTALLALGVAMVIRHGTRALCACFGARSSRPLGRAQLARNLCLFFVVCAGLAAVPLAHGRPPLLAMVLAAGAGPVTALLFIRWDYLAELFAPLPTSIAADPVVLAARQPARKDG